MLRSQITILCRSQLVGEALYQADRAKFLANKLAPAVDLRREFQFRPLPSELVKFCAIFRDRDFPTFTRAGF